MEEGIQLLASPGLEGYWESCNPFLTYMEVSPSEKNGAVLNPLLQTYRCLTAHSHIGLGNMGPITVISGQVRLSQSYYKQDGFSPENEPHKGLPEVIFPTIQEKWKSSSSFLILEIPQKPLQCQCYLLAWVCWRRKSQQRSFEVTTSPLVCSSCIMFKAFPRLLLLGCVASCQPSPAQWGQ